jgi:hypothetical protein
MSSQKRFCDLSNWLNNSSSGSSSSGFGGYADTLTNVLCTTFYIKDCVNKYPFGRIDCSDICPNDKEFYWLVDSADNFKQLQFNFVNNIETEGAVTYGWNIGSPADYLIEIRAINCCDDSEYVDNDTIVAQDLFFVGKIQIGMFGGYSYKDVQQIMLDLDNIPYDCFYFRLRVHQDLSKANYIDYYSMPYKRVNCNNKAWHTFESKYTGFDNIGYSYSHPVSHVGHYFDFSNKMIFEGEFAKQNYTPTQNLINNTDLLESQQISQYRFRMLEAPEQVMDIMANILNGYELKIDNEQYVWTGAADKNFDDGADWYSDILFTQYKDKISHICRS